MTRSYPTQPGFGVGAVVIEDGKVLLIRRGQPPLEGRWTLPGGMVELGETLEDALRREVRKGPGGPFASGSSWPFSTSSRKTRTLGSATTTFLPTFSVSG